MTVLEHLRQELERWQDRHTHLLKSYQKLLVRNVELQDQLDIFEHQNKILQKTVDKQTKQL